MEEKHQTDPNDELDIEGMIKGAEAAMAAKKAAYRPITFKEYLKLVEKDPTLAQNSASRILDIINSYGVEEIPEDERWFSEVTHRWRLFGNLYGLEKPINEFVDHIKTGALDLPPGKKLLLIVGPPASGKSSFVDILVEALEKYDKPIYRIQGCPINEEPLHLLPESQREEFYKKTRLRLTNRHRLCPRCRYMLKTKYTEKWWEVMVEPWSFSSQDGLGIGCFEAGDKFQSVSVLTGSENVAITATHGPDHPYAFSLNGEICKSNRGLFEARELLKVNKTNPELMSVFLSLAEEKRIKVQGSNFPDITIDTTAVAHTNLKEFKEWNADPKNEALHSRFRKIHFPYALRIKDEVQIYRKLIEKESKFKILKKCHIAPGSLELAALFAVMTRLVESGRIDKLTKAKIYNGDKVLTEVASKEGKKFDVRELILEGQRDANDRELPIDKQEGMFGMGPRDMMDAICNGLVKYSEGNGCLTPARTIKAIRDGLRHLTGYTPEQIASFENLLSVGQGETVMAEYKDFVIKAVTRAFLRAYQDLAQELFDKYIENIRLDRMINAKISPGIFKIERDELTGAIKEPDEELMKAIEAEMGYSQNQAETVRGEILSWKEFYNSRGFVFSYQSYEPLAKAIEKYLIRQTKDTLKLVLNPDKAKDESQRKRVQDIFDALTDKTKPVEARFCDICAKEIVERASEFLR